MRGPSIPRLPDKRPLATAVGPPSVVFQPVPGLRSTVGEGTRHAHPRLPRDPKTSRAALSSTHRAPRPRPMSRESLPNPVEPPEIRRTCRSRPALLPARRDVAPTHHFPRSRHVPYDHFLLSIGGRRRVPPPDHPFVPRISGRYRAPRQHLLRSVHRAASGFVKHRIADFQIGICTFNPT